MNKRVYNKTVGKIFRTLGFLLILVASLVFISELILVSDLAFLASIEPIASNISGLLPAAVYEYVGLGLIVGLLCLVWAIRRGFLLRVLVTVLLVVTLAVQVNSGVSFLSGMNVVAPSWLDSAVAAVSGPLDQLLAISEWIEPGVALFSVMLLWGVFANARPKRFSIFFVRVATITLFLGIVLYGLQANLSTSTFVSATWYVTILNICYLLSYALIAGGSVFGVLGFYRK